MKPLISYCGIVCDSCPIYLATIEQDSLMQQSMRASIANDLTEFYGMTTKPEEINDCHGCPADDAHVFSGCLQCDVRKCARRKHRDNCAFCPEYPCQALSKHFANDPEAEIRLNEIRLSGKY